MPFRYVVTDYERSNFSVFQTKYEEGLKSHLVPIPSAGEIPENHQVSLATKLGASIGSIAFVLACIFAVLLTLRKFRTSSKTGRQADNVDHRERAWNTELPNHVFQPREIDMSSPVGQHQELSDTSKAELSDSTAPLELSVVSPRSVHELMAQQRPPRLETGSNDQYLNTKNKLTIVVATDFSRESWTSFDTSSATPCVETTIYSVPPKSIDLNRSLPPTPVLESVQASPIINSIQKRSPLLRGLRSPPGDSSRVRSVAGTVLHRGSGMSTASAEMEIVIPPGVQLSEAEITRPLTIRKSFPNARRHNFEETLEPLPALQKNVL